MKEINVNEVQPHPNNKYYFDDIKGDGWDDLLQSIRTSGVTNAITVTESNIIISGHQRVRACKLLGIDKIPAHVIRYTDDELNKRKDIKDLIESNLKQRVPGNSNPVKLGRCFAFLKEYYGSKEGRPKKPENNFPVSKTVGDIAEENGVTKQTVNNLVRLSKAIPEIQELVETGKVSPTTALSILRQLPEEEQRKLANSLIESESRTSIAKVQELIDQIAEKDRRISELESQKPEVKEVEVVPDDYEKIKRENQAFRSDNRSLQNYKTKSLEEINLLKERIRDLETRSDLEELQNKVKAEAGYFAIRTYNYIQQNGGCVWIFEQIENLSEKERKDFIDAIYAANAFIQQMISNIGGYSVE